MSTRHAGLVVAAVILVAGIIFGFVPHSVNPANDAQASVSCGSAFKPDEVSAIAGSLGSAINFNHGWADAPVDYQTLCADTLSSARTTAWVLVGLGGLAALFLFLTSRQPVAPVEQSVGT